MVPITERTYDVIDHSLSKTSNPSRAGTCRSRKNYRGPTCLVAPSRGPAEIEYSSKKANPFFFFFLLFLRVVLSFFLFFCFKGKLKLQKPDKQTKKNMTWNRIQKSSIGFFSFKTNEWRIFFLSSPTTRKQTRTVFFCRKGVYPISQQASQSEP